MTPAEHIIADVGNGPRTAGMLAGALMRHGWPSTAVDAAVAHATYELLCAKRIEVVEVEGEKVYRLPASVALEDR